MPATADGLRGRLGWGLFDQALSSGTNFLLVLAVARLSATPEGFGAFAVGFTVYVIGIGAGRAIVAEPFAIDFPGSSDDRMALGTARGIAVSLWIGFIGGLFIVLIATQLEEPLRGVLYMVGFLMPGLVLQDVLRYVFIAAGYAQRAALNDGIWALLIVAALSVAAVSGIRSAMLLTLLWAATGGLSALIIMLTFRVVPRLSEASDWTREYSHLIPRFLGEFALVQVSAQSATLIVASVIGLAAAGSLRAAQALFGPLNMLLMAAHLVMVPEAVRMMRSRGMGALRRLVHQTAIATSLAASIWMVVLIVTPTRLGVGLMGETWSLAAPLFGYIGALKIFTGVSIAALIGLRARQDAKASLWSRGILGGGVLTGTALGAPLGVESAALGMAAGTAVGAAAMYRSLRSGLTKDGPMATE